ncbi:hypothetical protein QQY24_16960 [Streptomyces sp. TG1A-8]|uniref:hypothetical protein n=1 Tax=Streptomyces sp. TG1A-8 TaxID=3051385 RepID=UPI00265C4AF9|nr:hypothetical protein [Streptomyces sp. TG1A-8]MDO0927021.1 hypothetical protein [Streptomyces sp. TG1A-8]
MRPLYVPVRLAVTVLALSAAAGCVDVGDDAGRAGPSHSAGRHAVDAPGDVPVKGVGGAGDIGPPGVGGHGRRGRAKPAKPAPTEAAPSGADTGSAPPSKAGATVRPGDPAPTERQPLPPVTSAPPEPPAPTPPPPASPPPSAEPSSSAHEDPAPQLVQREPAPAAGRPA